MGGISQIQPISLEWPKIQVKPAPKWSIGLGPSWVWVKLQHYHVQLCAKDYLIYNALLILTIIENRIIPVHDLCSPIVMSPD